jgi:2-phospho-L-lactate guanylyltransferase
VDQAGVAQAGAGQGGARVVVAVKRLDAAKSRLGPALGERERSALVLAMLTDTLSAALRCPVVASVHVVTADPAVVQAARAAGAVPLADPTGSLNDALVHAADLLGAERTVLALQGDLPALRPTELTAAVSAAAGGRAAVADAAGTGTTLLIAPAGTALDPHFGPGSATAHAVSGAHLLGGGWPGLRADVDTVTDLGAAVRAGVGPATAALLDAAGTPATVSAHEHGVVELRTDAGGLLRCAEAAAVLGGWPRIHVGQRVRVHAGADGAAYLLTAAIAAPG